MTNLIEHFVALFFFIKFGVDPIEFLDKGPCYFFIVFKFLQDDVQVFVLAKCTS